MILNDYYWYFKSAIPPRICDDIIEYALSKKEEMARTGGFQDKNLNKDEIAILKKRRHSDVTWLNDTWIYKEIQPYVKLANESAGWNFEWD